MALRGPPGSDRGPAAARGSRPVAVLGSRVARAFNAAFMLLGEVEPAPDLLVVGCVGGAGLRRQLVPPADRRLAGRDSWTCSGPGFPIHC